MAYVTMRSALHRYTVRKDTGTREWIVRRYSLHGTKVLGDSFHDDQDDAMNTAQWNVDNDNKTVNDARNKRAGEYWGI